MLFGGKVYSVEFSVRVRAEDQVAPERLDHFLVRIDVEASTKQDAVQQVTKALERLVERGTS